MGIFEDQLAALALISGDTNYINKLNQALGILAEGLDQQVGQVGSITGFAAYAVPVGLQQIFDRRGLVGAAAYALKAGVLDGPDYNLVVNPGAFWSGTTFAYKQSSMTISLALLATGGYFLNLDALGNPTVAAAATAGTVRQFHWDASTHTVSAETLYAGVAILLSGADYAAMLTSAARSKSFTRVADRLEEIEVLLGKNVQTPASADTINVNWALGGIVRVTLDRATTTFAFSGAYDGQKLVLEIIQDVVGGRGIAFGSEVVAGTDFTLPVPLSAAGKTDYLGFIYNAGSGKYHYTSLARGY